MQLHYLLVALCLEYIFPSVDFQPLSVFGCKLSLSWITYNWIFLICSAKICLLFGQINPSTFKIVTDKDPHTPFCYFLHVLYHFCSLVLSLLFLCQMFSRGPFGCPVIFLCILVNFFSQLSCGTAINILTYSSLFWFSTNFVSTAYKIFALVQVFAHTHSLYITLSQIACLCLLCPLTQIHNYGLRHFSCKSCKKKKRISNQKYNYSWFTYFHLSDSLFLCVI